MTSSLLCTLLGLRSAPVNWPVITLWLLVSPFPFHLIERILLISFSFPSQGSPKQAWHSSSDFAVSDCILILLLIFGLGKYRLDVLDGLYSIIHKCLDIQMRSEKNPFFEIYLTIPDIDLENVSSTNNSGRYLFWF